MKVELMDTTLRDGEQTVGVSFNEDEKLSIAKLLLSDVHVDRVEVASARVSDGEFNAVKKITNWAYYNNYLDKVEILGFVDNNVSINWIKNAGGKVINLLCKGSENHLKYQLKKTPEQHMDDIRKAVAYAKKLGLNVNVYLEDWSNGMIYSRDYVFKITSFLRTQPVERIMLPDTLGILNPLQTLDFCEIMTDKFSDVHFDFHAHNDYDMAIGNVYMAVSAGIKGVHATVNGLGERAGNATLSSIVSILNDHLRAENNIDETKLAKISRLVETFSGIRVPPNKPVVGENVFTQTCGVHADGDRKKHLYYNNLTPERFGRIRQYALGKTSGKANILQNLEELGIELDPESIKKLTIRVIELGDKKEVVTKEDLPFIIADILDNKQIKRTIEISHFNLSLANGLRPVANIMLKIDGTIHEESAVGDGQYDAFMKAL